MTLNKAPQNKVRVTPARHSGILLAGIHKNSLDTGQKHAGMTKGIRAAICVVLY